MIHTLDPHVIRIPGHHDRALTAPDLSDLTASIAEIGQQVPIVLRDADGPELVCGARRLLACRALGLPVLAELRDLSDEAAFVLRDAENRHRADICDLDRARSYAAALTAHYGGNRSEMARRIGMTRPHLGRLVAMAAIPDAVVAAFRSRADLCERHARRLAPVLGQAALTRQARALAGKGLPANVVTRCLLAACGIRAPGNIIGTFRRNPTTDKIVARRIGRKIVLEFDAALPPTHFDGAITAFRRAVMP